jgi:tRNA pseudouridine38-40 synthase
VAISLEGDGFLRHMVRIVAGTLVDVGLGRRPAEEMPALLACRDRTRAGRTAPARGLVLVRVDY